MSRSIFAAFFILFVSITAASAQSCNAYPNTLTNGTNADASQVMGNFNYVLGCVRDRLTAARTYYVRTDGNDAFCTGLTNAAYASGAFPQNCAFLTLQKAYNNIAASLDLSGFTVTVQIGDGTYTGGLVVSQPWTGGGAVTFQGNSATPANVLISTSSPSGLNAFGTTGSLPGTLTIRDLKVTTTVGSCIAHYAVGLVQFANINFGACFAGQVEANGSGVNLECVGNYTISGNAFAHVIASRPSNVSIRSKTITLTGSPAFSSAFALAANGGVIVLDGNTYTGTATGLKYRAQDGGQVYTPGITLPGNTAGAGTNYGVAPYGQYTGP